MNGRYDGGGPTWDGSVWDDDQDFTGQDPYGQRRDERGYGQPNGSAPRDRRRPAGAPRGGQAPGPTQQLPPGYDRRDTGPRYDAGYGQQGGYGPQGGYGSQGGYGQQAGYGQQGGYGDQGDDSFLPGFGGSGRGYGGYDDPRDPRGGDPRDPRGGDPRGPRGPGGSGGTGPGGRGPYGRGPQGRGGWEDERDTRPPRRRKSVMRRLAPWIAVLVILAPIVYGGLYVYSRYKDKYHPIDYAGAGTGNVTVEVLNGDTAYSVAPRLLSLGVIGSTRAFENAADNAANTAGTASSGLEAGYFVLHHHMQASLAYAALVNPKNRVQTTVTIPEGKRASQVALILAKYTKIPLKQFQQIIAHPPASLGLPAYAKGKVEGYLFPATYAIIPHETALQILQAMVQRFNVEAEQVNLAAAAKAAGLTPGAVIIDASMAQAEGGSDSDFPKIAEVINNRLKVGMHLDFDSTVVYGLGKYSVSATLAELKINTPYNTYMHAGRPIAPISNPGDAAIQAVLHPAKGDYLYFLTKPGGASEFSHSCLPGQC